MRMLLAVALLLAGTGAAIADDDVQTCAGFKPPYKNTCAYPISVWYKALKGGTVKSVNLQPGQSAPTYLTAEEKAGVSTAVCKAGEMAFDFSGGVHGSTPWTGSGNYECRRK